METRVKSTDAHDAFFDDLYVSTTEPFLTQKMTAAEVEAFVSLTKVTTGARVLDLACGWGRHGPLLRRLGLEVHGLERAARSAHRAAGQGLKVLRGDVRSLPYRTASFDAIGCFYSSLFFFGDEENLKSLGEVARVLKPQGSFLLQAANPLHLMRLGADEFALRLPDGTQVSEHTHFDADARCEVGQRQRTLADGTVQEGGYRIRHYLPEELEAFGRNVGLRLHSVRGSLSLEPWTEMSKEVVALMMRT